VSVLNVETDQETTCIQNLAEHTSKANDIGFRTYLRVPCIDFGEDFCPQLDYAATIYFNLVLSGRSLHTEGAACLGLQLTHEEEVTKSCA
jgi:hypothetical protein